MIIQFVQEDGTGKANATSYASTAQILQYWLNRGVDYSAKTTAILQAWLNSATEFIDSNYKFFSSPSFPNVQKLQFPRTGLRNSRGKLIADNEIPTELIEAVCRLAPESLTTSDLFSKLEAGVQSKSIGPVSISYSAGYKAEFKNVGKLLMPFIKSGAGLPTVS